MCRRRPYCIVLGLLGLLLGSASPVLALDAETQQLEKEVLCQTAPWRCGQTERGPAAREPDRVPVPYRRPEPKKPPEKSPAQLEKEVMCQAMPWSCGKIERAPESGPEPRPLTCRDTVKALCVAASGYTEDQSVQRWHIENLYDCALRYRNACPP